jgi:hypothetical protein
VVGKLERRLTLHLAAKRITRIRYRAAFQFVFGNATAVVHRLLCSAVPATPKCTRHFGVSKRYVT